MGTKVVRKELVEWIQVELDRQNLSQSEASRRAGLGPNAISEIVNGRVPGLRVCQALAKVFGYPVEHVLRLAGHLPPQPTTKEMDAETRYLLQQITRKLALLDQEEQGRLARHYLTQLDFALSLKGITSAEEENDRSGR